MKHRVMAIIPARGGSKGLPGKNIKNLGGKPLIAHTIEVARSSKYLDRIIVTTDDQEIRKVALEYGAEVPFLRPKELSGDNSPTIDAVLHCLEYIKENEEYIPDYICLLQCTVPLRTSEDIDRCIEKCILSAYESCISVCEVQSSPYWMKKFEGEKLVHLMDQKDTILRRQDLPQVYEINGAVYVISTQALLAHQSIHIENTTGYIMPKERSVDIDDELDFMLAETILRYNHKKGGDSY